MRLAHLTTTPTSGALFTPMPRLCWPRCAAFILAILAALLLSASCSAFGTAQPLKPNRPRKAAAPRYNLTAATVHGPDEVTVAAYVVWPVEDFEAQMVDVWRELEEYRRSPLFEDAPP